MRNAMLFLAVLFSSASAAAEDAPGNGPGPRPDHSGPRGPHPRPPAAAGSAAPGASALHERREQLSERFRDRMERMQDRMHEMRERHERARTLGSEVAGDLKNGNPHPEDLKKKLEELKSLREDRRHEQRAFLHRRWGHGVGAPEAKDELERHARRLARLQRLEVVAATERTGDDRKRLIARIEQLRTLEEKRHEDAMKKLVPDAPPAAVASATPASSENPPDPPPAASAAIPAPGAAQ